MASPCTGTKQVHCRASMEKSTQIIYIQPLAPAKPAIGAPCNGCGVCCLYEPCPLGMLLSRKRTGACVALRWYAPLQLYRCGALSHSREVATNSLPFLLRWVTPLLAYVLQKSARRWIAAGKGCDSTLEIDHDATPNTPP